MFALAAVLLLTPALVNTAAAGSNVGVGLHYLRNLADIKDSNDFDKNAFSIIGSYQWAGPLIKVEGDLEYIFDMYGSGNSGWAPQAYVLAGGLIYGGVGMGIYYTDGDWANDPFYNLRAGVNLGLGGLNLDAFATYQFWSEGDLKDLTGEDFNAVTFAALLRFDL
jgi:hypothetical protein